MARGARTTSSSCARLIVAATLLATAGARAQDTAWDEAPRRPPPPPAGRAFPPLLRPLAQDDGPVPVSIDVDPGGALSRELAALAEARRPDELTRAARARALDPLVRARWIRDPLGGAALLGVQEAARRALAALPRELLAAARPTWDLELEASGLLARGGDEAAAREALSAFAEASAAPDVARRLGERCLERGDVEAALLYFRRALALDPPAGLARALRARIVALGARPGGALGLPRSPAPTLGLAWARRGAEAPLAAACDEARVFAVYPDRLLALDRRDGRVRWAVHEVAIDDAAARLALGHGLVLLVERAALRAFDPADGEPRWSVTLEAQRTAAGADDPTDGFVAAAASADGFVALATLGGGRRAIALDAAGAVRWSTALWGAREGGEAVTPVEVAAVTAHVAAFGAGGRVVTVEPGPGGDPARRASCPAPGEDGISSCGAPLVRGVRCPVCGYDAEPHVTALRFTPGALRAADGDGRVACLADRVVVSADGLVAALGLPRGETLWAHERGPGLGLHGRRAFVSLHARADAIEAVTGAGLLVRLDPLDGRLLPPPRPPADVAAGPPRVLAPDPVVLGWADGDGALRAGAGRLGPDAWPVGPGVVLRGRALVVPARDGVLTLDLRAGDVLGRVAWPFDDDARRRRLTTGPDDLVVAWGPGGLAAFAPGAVEPGDAVAALAPDAPLDALVAALDAPGWRGRLAARSALADRDDAAPALRTLLEGPAATAEAREVARELLVRVERRARWRQLAPDAPAAVLEPLLQRELRADALAAVAPHVGVGPEAAAALVALLPSARDLDARAALIDLALRAHEPLCGRLVAIIRNAQANPGLMLAAAEYLVDLARRGLDQPARRALINPDQLTRAVVQAVLLERGDDAVRERLRADPAYWEALRGDEVVDMLRAQMLGVEPDRGALIDELTRSLLP